MPFDSITTYPRTYPEQVAWFNQLQNALSDLSDLLVSPTITYSGTEYNKGRNLLLGADFKANPWQRLNHNDFSGNSVTHTEVLAAAGGVDDFYQNAKMFYLADKWYIYATDSFSSGDVTYERSDDAPTVEQIGFVTKSVKITSTGGNSGLRFGTALDLPSFARWFGQTSQFSFWVKCNKAVTLAYRFVSTYDKASNPKTFMNTFVISSANTWQNITVEIDPSDGTLGTHWHEVDNVANISSFPLQIEFILTDGAGSTLGTLGSWQNSNGYEPTSGMTSDGIENGGTDGEIYFAIPQLETDIAETPFEYKNPFEVKLECQRFYAQPELTFPSGVSNIFVSYPIKMYQTPDRAWSNSNFTNPYSGSADGTFLSQGGVGDQTTLLYLDADFYTTTN